MRSNESDLRSQTCCFTGHRRLPAERLGEISARLDAVVERLIGRGWPAADRARYERIRALADKVVLLAEEYDASCMLRRNLHLVRHSGVCVCYLEHARSGAGQTVRRARAEGVPVVNLA